jgi:hypothetical protein
MQNGDVVTLTDDEFTVLLEELLLAIPRLCAPRATDPQAALRSAVLAFVVYAARARQAQILAALARKEAGPRPYRVMPPAAMLLN